MNIQLVSTQYNLTEGISSYVNKRFEGLSTFLKGENLNVTILKDGPLHKISIITKYDGKIIKQEQTDDDLYRAIDILKDNLTEDLRRRKEIKIEREQKEGSYRQLSKNLVEAKKELKKEEMDNQCIKGAIVKRKVLELKPMMEEEAVLQMEMLGHDFFVYIDGETGETNVVYRRKDGNYGIIETELI